MAHKDQWEIGLPTPILHDKRWRWLLRSSKFWEDLSILNDKLSLFLDCSRSDQSDKFRDIRLKRFYEYESFKKRCENRWEITPIPMWAILLGREGRPSKKGIEKLENLSQELEEKPVPYGSVHRIGYDAVRELLDLRLDLMKPLYVLLDAVKAEVEKLTRSTSRNRLDKADFELAVFDLIRFEGMKFNGVARKLHKPASTVRSAYYSACQKIGEGTPSKNSKRVSESDPGPIPQCPNVRCRSAQKPEDFCSAHKAWIEQGQGYTRESLVPDISAIEHAKARL